MARKNLLSIDMFSLELLLGICFGEGFHLCGGNTEPGLICAYYLNSISTQESMNLGQTLHCVQANIFCAGLENTGFTLVQYGLLFLATLAALGMACQSIGPQPPLEG